MAQTRKQKVLEDVKKARRTRTILTVVIIVVLAVGVAAGVILLSHPTPPNPLIGTPISSGTYNQLTGVSTTTLNAVGTSQAAPLTTVNGSPTLNSSGKPEVLYIGGDFCPYCAAERWSIIVALSKFGNFTGLTYMISADPPENPADISTFSFSNASYSSPYIAFSGVEEYHRDRTAFQTPSSTGQDALNKYDPSGNIPFVDIANQYVDNSGAQYSVAVISGLNWDQIGTQLNSPGTGIAGGIDGAANTLIRAICNVDGGNPRSLCSLTLAKPTQAPSTVGNMQLPNTFSVTIACDARDNEFSRITFRSLP